MKLIRNVTQRHKFEVIFKFLVMVLLGPRSSRLKVLFLLYDKSFDRYFNIKGLKAQAIKAESHISGV